MKGCTPIFIKDNIELNEKDVFIELGIMVEDEQNPSKGGENVHE